MDWIFCKAKQKPGFLETRADAERQENGSQSGHRASTACGCGQHLSLVLSCQKPSSAFCLLASESLLIPYFKPLIILNILKRVPLSAVMKTKTKTALQKNFDPEKMGGVEGLILLYLGSRSNPRSFTHFLITSFFPKSHFSNTIQVKFLKPKSMPRAAKFMCS